VSSLGASASVGYNFGCNTVIRDVVKPVIHFFSRLFSFSISGERAGEAAQTDGCGVDAGWPGRRCRRHDQRHFQF
jgi:hypothetical protein